MNHRFQRWRLRARVLSALHIGTGDLIDPMELIERGGVFHRVRLEDLLLGFTDDERADFDRALRRAALAEMRSVVARAFRPEEGGVLYAIEPFDGFLAYAREKASNNFNLFQIQEAQRDADGSLRVPGSSLKGALRTALLDARAQSSMKGRRIDSRTFENDVLRCGSDRNPAARTMHKDPFRALRVRDATIPADCGRLALVSNRSLKRGDSAAKGILMQFEIAAGAALGVKSGFETEIALDEWPARNGQFAEPLEIEEIEKACRAFYQAALADEIKRFHLPWQSIQIAQEKASGPASAILGFGKDEFPLRLGRFSHMECVTVRDFRQVRDRQGQIQSEGSSRSLVEGKYPLGWLACKLERIE